MEDPSNLGRWIKFNNIFNA